MSSRSLVVVLAFGLAACSTGSQPTHWSDLHANPREFFNLNPPVQAAGETVAGSAITLQRGQALVVRLPEDPAAGYTWRMRPLPRGAVVAPIQRDFTAKPGIDPTKTTGGGEATFRLRGVDAGTQAITIDSFRSGFTTPERSIAFDVVVR